jgi:membrane protein
MIVSATVRIVKEAISAAIADKITTLSAALAYYALFSLSPLLLIALSLLSVVYGNAEARNRLIGQLDEAVGRPTAAAIEDLLESADRARSAHVTLFALALLVFGASGVFVALQDALNTIWKANRRPSSGLLQFMRVRLLSMASTIATCLLLLVMLIVSTIISGLSNWLPADRIPGGLWLWTIVNFAISFVFVTMILAVVFKVMPEGTVAWGDVWVGALLSGFLFSLAKYAFGIYLVKAGVTANYGAAASLVVILVWVYFSSAIVLFGAEVSCAYARITGSRRRGHQLLMRMSTGAVPR